MLHISGGPSRYVRCSFRDVKLKNWLAHEVELIDCVFAGKLEAAVFNGAVREHKRAYLGRERNEISGNDFSQMDFVDVGFRKGVDLSQQVLPSGPDYVYVPDAPSAVQRARLALLSWSNLELRQEAFTMLKRLEENVNEGQEQLLLRMSNHYIYESPRREAVDTLYALLKGELTSLS